MIRRAALRVVRLTALAIVARAAAADPVITDGAWHEIPGSGRTLSQPVGIFIPAEKNSQYANSIGVVIRGADQGIYYQNYSLTAESWIGRWTFLTAQTSVAPFTFVGDAWDILAKDLKTGKSIHTINWSNGWTGWVNEGSADLPWGSPMATVDGRARLWAFRRGPNDTVEYRCTPPRPASPTPAASRTMLAFYYPWYGVPSGPSRRWVHWDPVKRNYTHTPSLGLYDSKDPQVIRQHVEWALTAGIDGFISSWWGQNTFEDQAFRELLKVAEAMGFQVTVYYETAANKEQVLRDFRYLLDRYGNSPAFLKWQGKPVIFVYGRVTGGQIPLLDWDWVFGALQAEGRAAVFIGDGLTPELAYFFDGIHTYNVAGQAPRQVRTQYLSAASLAKKQGRLFAGTVIPGYDDTINRKPGLKVDRRNGALYRELWQTVLDAKADWVLITSFNEWHEGTEIEPSQEYGEQYLGLTAEFARVFKQDSIPPRVAITAPLDRATLSGMVQVTAEASDNGAVSLVRYLVDGREQAAASASPYTFQWDTAGVPRGPHTLTAQAFDRAGNSASQAVTVMIEPQ
jgi:Glycosyl hydrolase family 99/Bacterial Ig domain